MTPFKKDKIWWLKLMIVVMTIICLSVGVVSNKVSLEKIDSLQAANDSLNAELFIQKTIVGRYELTINHFVEEKKLDSTEVEKYLSNETE